MNEENSQSQGPMVINFDAILGKKGQLKLLETGQGVYGADYYEGDRGYGQLTTRDKIVKELLTLYDHVYILSIGAPTCLFSLSPQFPEEHREKVSHYYGFDRFIKDKDGLNPNGIIIPDICVPGPQAFDVELALREKGIALPVSNSTGMEVMFSSKLDLASVLRDIAPELIPKQMLLEFDDEDSINRACSLFDEDSYVVLKPLQGTCGEAIVLLQRKKLRAVSQWLLASCHGDGFDTPLQNDPESANRLMALARKQETLLSKSCIVQEYVFPKLISVSHKDRRLTFRPTVRFVVLATFDRGIGKTRVRFVDAFYKLPEAAVVGEAMNWHSCISHTAAVRNAEVGQHALRAYKQSFGLAENYPSFAQIGELEDWRAIEEQSKGLEPFFHYLLTTNVAEYYQLAFQEKKEVGTLLKKREHFWFKLENGKFNIAELFLINFKSDPAVYKVLKDNGLNIAVMLLWDLYEHFILQDKMGVRLPVPLNWLNLFIQYESMLDRMSKNEGFVSHCVSYQLLFNQSGALREAFFNEDLRQIETKLIQVLRKLVGNEILCGVFHRKALNYFKENRFSEAARLFLFAALYLPEGTDDQASAYYSLASCFKHQGHYEEAVKAAEQSVSIRRTLLEGRRIKLGNYHRSVSKLDEVGRLLRNQQKERRRYFRDVGECCWFREKQAAESGKNGAYKKSNVPLLLGGHI